MKELDVVKIIKDYEGIPSGTQGTIVCEYDGKAFEVEFFDDNGDTIDVVTTPAELLELVEEYASDLINKYSGKGTPVGIGKERVDFGKVIGYYVDKETGKKYPTTMGIIHSSKNGKHIVPSKPKNFKGE